MNDIDTELQDQVLRLMEEARTCPLTKLGNYKALREYTRMLAGLGIPFSVLLFDLTNLKAANTALGHFGADALIFKVADRIRSVGDRRSEGNDVGFDSVYRHGGDEFSVVLPQCPPAAATRVLDRIEGGVGSTRLRDGTPVRLIGSVAHVPPGGEVEAELNRADKALENRKKAWKDAMCLTGVVR